MTGIPRPAVSVADTASALAYEEAVQRYAFSPKVPATARNLPPRGRAAALVAAGWRFVGVPAMHELVQGCRPVLLWDCDWLAIPPEGHAERARRFGTKHEAVTWAAAVAGGAA